MHRRQLLSDAFRLLTASFLGSCGVFAAASAAEPPPGAPPGEAFSEAWLRDQARDLASKSYQAPKKITLPALAQLDPSTYHSIRHRSERALWREEGLAFQLRLFHLGSYFLHPVEIFEVVDARAHPIAFSRALFDYGQTKLEGAVPDNAGFAGFRLHYHTDFERDIAAFLGASYFRAVSAEMQYGISARGLAIDTALPHGEEFPSFNSFWIERPSSGATQVTVHALLDSPSMTGAYKFIIRPGKTTVMDVEVTLFPRKEIKRLGLAPLTSMFHHGENDRRLRDDFRPEVHDSDGLAIVRGNGERLWRPLVNPSKLRVNSYGDENPRGFGLLQRDRRFANYQEDGAYYNRRPNLWVVPRGDWGRGAVYLIEIPAEDEAVDNIVAFWTPQSPPKPGREFRIAYWLNWSSDIPDIQSPVGHVVATRIGAGGTPGRKRPAQTRKMVVDFSGGSLDLPAKTAKIEPVINASRGSIAQPTVRWVGDIACWRLEFDLKWEGHEPIDLRAFLKLGPAALTETWTYQWSPQD